MTILFTSALTHDFFDQRKIEYEESFKLISDLKYGEFLQIVECVYQDEKKTFLDELSSNVFYSKKGYNFKNKGVNEILNIKNYLQNSSIGENEKIIKLTGRYIFLDDFFLNTCSTEDYDIILKMDEHEQVFFGCFCAKRKVFSDFILSTDWNMVENNFICIEKIFADFIKNSEYSILKLPKINIKCNINNHDLQFL